MRSWWLNLVGDDSTFRFGIAWIALVLAVALHVLDEALTGFLGVYNPTVVEMRRRIRWLPMPTFKYSVWLVGLIVGLSVALMLSPLAFHFPREFRPFAIGGAVLMVLNGIGHLLGTIAGHTFNGIRFPRPMPGTYSSPTMIAAAIYLLMVCCSI